MYRYIIAAILLIVPYNIYSQTDKYLGITELDTILQHHDEITNRKINQIESLKYLLVRTDSLERRYDICDLIFNEYLCFQLDSALSYGERKLKIASKLNNDYYINKSTIEIANMYIKAGMNMQSYDLLQHIDRSELCSGLLQDYYSINNNLYEFLSQFALNQSVREEYKKKARSYRDSVLMHEPNDMFVYTYSLLSDGKYQKGLNILLNYFEGLDPDQREVGPTAYSISEYYRSMENREEEKKFLIISAASDIKHGIKEYCSLSRLAMVLYEEGDYERAHKYVEVALNDAIFCDAKMRTLEVTDILPIIETDYQQRLKSQRSNLTYALTSISILMILLIVILVMLHRYQGKLNCAKKQVDKTNKLLTESNRLLAESSSIKNIYIFNLMMECVNRIESFDNYRRSLNKKAISGDRNSVFTDLKSPEVIEHEYQSFYAMFDKTFLQLFPSFVQDINSLLKPEEWFIEVKEWCLPTELRIFALIRLGITDTDRIASLLRYSKSTIYAYRSRTRLKAVEPDKFETQIMKISSI